MTICFFILENHVKTKLMNAVNYFNFFIRYKMFIKLFSL